MNLTPLEPPFSPEASDLLARMMPARMPIPPLALFRVLAAHLPLATAMQGLGSYVLGKHAALPPRIRELVILRTCARCGCEYEWGVHATAFAGRVGLEPTQLGATVKGSSADFVGLDASIIEAVDQLHDHCAINPATFARCRSHLNETQLLELCTVTGWYHAIAFIAITSGIALEPWAARFPP